MKIAIVTGSAGLVGSQTVQFLNEKGLRVVGIDNDMRKVFFGQEASTQWRRRELEESIPNYTHRDQDIRDKQAMENIFKEFGADIALVIHAASQPSHDWAARDPLTDFTVNADGTLILLELARQYCPAAVFIFVSTNKVYGDRPNELPLEDQGTRWEVKSTHPYAEHGIDESMSVDMTRHSLFGVSKASADLLVQEYGRYFQMKTACFRAGCITGPAHSGTALHGFLAYLMKCTMTGQPYTVIGYQGKQVRDNIHSRDLVDAFWHYYQNPQPAAVYNIGGGRYSNCSMLEAIDLCQQMTGKKLNWTYQEQPRIGDHIWWISDVRKFQKDYPEWKYRYGIREILLEIETALCRRLTPDS